MAAKGSTRRNRALSRLRAAKAIGSVGVLHARAAGNAGPTLRRPRQHQPSVVLASSGFTRNHAAYSAGRNTNVSTVPTINPPMIEIAIEP